MKMKMKKRSFAIAALALCMVIGCGVFVFTGCSCSPALDDAALTKKVIADFTGAAEARSEMFESDGWENGEPFNAWWIKDNVSYEGSKLSLAISEMTAAEKTHLNSLAGYYGGEVRSSHYYGYGDFKVRMKPSKIAGTASTFFTCTGPYDVWYNEDGTEARKNNHDEIDIEFLGKDTTHVQFNYFASGVGGHEYMYKLGFDASEEFHDYGFRWTKDDITWFVDDKPVYKVKRSEIKAGESWPEEPGRVLMNYWSATQKASAWMGAFANDYSGRSEYLWASSTAAPCPDPLSSKPESEGVLIGTEVVKFAGSAYVIESSDDKASMTVKYSDLSGKSYSNIVGGVSDIIGDNNTFNFKVKNNGAAEAKIRVDIICPAGSGTNGYDFCNKKADISGATDKGNDYQYGGADWLKVAPGATAAVSVQFTTGVGANEIKFFIDSSTWDDTTTHTGEVVFNEMNFSKTEPVGPPTPGDGESVAVLDSVTFTGDIEYTVNKATDNSTLTVSYTDLKGNTYKTISGDISAIVSENNAVTFKVTNNGSADAKIRADIKCTAGEGTYGDNAIDGEPGKSDFCNISAVVTGAVTSGNDYQYGGADWFTVAAGETATVTIEFTTGVGANALSFFIDSSTWNDETTHTGEVVFSEMSLFKASA